MLVDEPDGMKERQTSKIKELADTLVAVGFASLDEQAKALGLSRSTTWTILRAKHKNYGLSAALIDRVLRKSDLDPQVRAKFVEYAREKAAGKYGHNDNQLRRFVRHFDGPTAPGVHDKLFAVKTERNVLEPLSAKIEHFKLRSVSQRDQ